MDHPEATDPQADPRVVPDRLRLPLSFDAGRLAEDLDHLDGNWTPHFVRQNYSGDWGAIPLRAPGGETHPVRMIYPNPTQQRFVETPALLACPYFREVLASFRCTILSTRLMRLAPGSVIKEHTDLGLQYEEGLARIHVPVLTNPDVEFYLNGSRVIMTAGSCWYLRLSDPHRVANRGKTDRVHLVIDLKVNGWLVKLFRACATAVAPAT
jgi:hypothetical protein